MSFGIMMTNNVGKSSSLLPCNFYKWFFIIVSMLDYFMQTTQNFLVIFQCQFKFNGNCSMIAMTDKFEIFSALFGNY